MDSYQDAANAKAAPDVRQEIAAKLENENSLDSPDFYLGRDISWLRFNERVLAEAVDASTPLLERLKFLSISLSNLNEFFMKRIALLRKRLETDVDRISHDGLTVREQIEAVRPIIEQLQRNQERCWSEQLRPNLVREGIRLISYEQLEIGERNRISTWCHANVFPILTPLAVDPGHRFPFISNLSHNLGVLLSQSGRSERLFARLKIPDSLPRLIAIRTDGQIGEIKDFKEARLITIEEVIQHNLSLVFPGLEVADIMSFRVTRGVGLDMDDDEVEDLLESVEASLRIRRLAEPVRLETRSHPSNSIMKLLQEELELENSDVYIYDGPAEETLDELYSIDRPDLKENQWRPTLPPRLRSDDDNIFSTIRERDILVNHPYESFTASIERFIAAAASDPHVLAIKQTLYRTSADSPFIDSLIKAAQDGKQVACLVELRARFDEDKNVHLARHLEKNGVHVAYGVVGLKIHSKCSLVVRREQDGLQCYAHVGTGNYHPGTAQLYTDLGLLTCDAKITDDIVSIFNYLTGRSLNRHYQKILVAPVTMRHEFYDLIDAEIAHAKAGRPARIIAKMNQLEDIGMIRRLYEASQAGVKITLIVRGFCCLRAGIPGVSENIQVLSIIGRFLEHTRIFHFSNGQNAPLDGHWFIGSADWMSRNLTNRVEIITPVEDQAARQRLLRILEVSAADRRDSWEMQGDGVYKKRIPTEEHQDRTPEAIGSFEALCEDALAATSASEQMSKDEITSNPAKHPRA